MGSPAVGDSAPDFSLADTTGADIRLSDLRGQRVHLVFNRRFS